MKILDCSKGHCDATEYNVVVRSQCGARTYSTCITLDPETDSLRCRWDVIDEETTLPVRVADEVRKQIYWAAVEFKNSVPA